MPGVGQGIAREIRHYINAWDGSKHRSWNQALYQCMGWVKASPVKSGIISMPRMCQGIAREIRHYINAWDGSRHRPWNQALYQCLGWVKASPVKSGIKSETGMGRELLCIVMTRKSVTQQINGLVVVRNLYQLWQCWASVVGREPTFMKPRLF